MSDGKIYYSGSQWNVTDYGIEQRDYYQSNGQQREGWYHIPAQTIAASPDMVSHMSEKDWVDIEDFKRAFDIARSVHK
jgi:hypothetical protein